MVVDSTEILFCCNADMALDSAEILFCRDVDLVTDLEQLIFRSAANVPLNFVECLSRGG